MAYPKYVKVDNIKYPINTDYRVAIECNRIAEDENIGDFERVLALIYTLFGEKALNTPEHYEKLLELAKKYLLCGKEYKNENNEKPDMDFIEDMPYIKASFKSDFNINLNDEKMHWWEFNEYLDGLSNSELGNCCVLNRVRELRNLDLSKIKDAKERDRLSKAKERVALHKNNTKREFTKEEIKNMEEYHKIFD